MSTEKTYTVPIPGEFFISRESGIFIAYNRKINKLAYLCEKYGSDKGAVRESGHPYPWSPHTYVDFYALLFRWGCDRVTKVFECGIGTNNPVLASSMGACGSPGASLRVWRDYFKNARIYGADIDKSILFEEERIKTAFMDQTSPESVSAYWSGFDETGFDIMIDDGLHKYHAGICLFENSISRLHKNGYYIIEDVCYADIFKYQNYFDNTGYIVDYICLYAGGNNAADNNLVVIRTRD